MNALFISDAADLTGWLRFSRLILSQKKINACIAFRRPTHVQQNWIFGNRSKSARVGLSENQTKLSRFIQLSALKFQKRMKVLRNWSLALQMYPDKRNYADTLWESDHEALPASSMVPLFCLLIWLTTNEEIWQCFLCFTCRWTKKKFISERSLSRKRIAVK